MPREAARALRDGGGLLAVLPLALWWAAWRGGLATTLVVPGVLWLAGCTWLLQVATPARRPSRAGAIVALALAALAALGGASVAWAADPAAATDAALRLALAAGAFALVVLWPPTPRGLRGLVLALPACALTGLVSGVAGALGDAGSLVDGRLSAPTGYPNATAVLCLAGAGPAVVLAADASRRAGTRALLTGVAAALGGGALLPQSRSVLLLVLPLALLLLAAAPSRARVAAVGGIAVALVAAAAPTLTAVRSAALRGDEQPALGGVLALAGLLVAGAAGGAALLAAERRGVGREAVATVRRATGRVLGRLPRPRLWPGPGSRPAGARPRPPGGRRAALAAAAVLAVLAAGAGVAATAGGDLSALSNPDYDRIETSGTRFSAGLRSNRPDYWRVALVLAERHPVGGVGAGNFGVAYLPLRRATTTPAAAHSTWLGTAAGLGVPGVLALATAVLTAGVAAVRRLAASRGAERATVLAALVPAVLLTIDATVDWTARVPLLVVLALAPVAAVVGPTAGPPRPARLPRGVGWLPAVALLVAVVLGARPFLAARDTDRAVAAWPSAPAAATAGLHRAARLVPHDARPVVQLGVLQLARGDRDAAAATMRAAVRRDPAGWYPHLALAALAASTGHRDAALARIAEVGERVARPRTAARLRRDVVRGVPVDPRQVQRRAFLQGP